MDAEVRYLNNLFNNYRTDQETGENLEIREANHNACISKDGNQSAAGSEKTKKEETAPAAGNEHGEEDEEEEGDGKVDFLEYLNPFSMVKYVNAKCEAVIKEEVTLDYSPSANIEKKYPVSRFQFERKGFFASDRDSTATKLVFNRTVGLNEAVTSFAEKKTDSRKAQQEAAAKLKEALMKVAPNDYFKYLLTTSVSKFDESKNPPLPTHDMEGKELSKEEKKKLFVVCDEEGMPNMDGNGEKPAKSMIKKGKKDLEKHTKLFNDTHAVSS